MTDVELIDAVNLYLKHQPSCHIDPCDCGMMTLYATLIHRLIPSQHPTPDVAELREQVAVLWEQPLGRDPSSLPHRKLSGTSSAGSKTDGCDHMRTVRTYVSEG